MMYRDARGRFRKPTDEERWPDPALRAIFVSMREYFADTKAEWEAMRPQVIRDLNFMQGEQWHA